MKQIYLVASVSLIAALIGGFVAGLVGNQPVPLGNSTASFWNANGGFRVDGTEVISSSRALTNIVGLTTSSGDLTVTTSNTATSTLEVGCIQMYATSTDTAVNLQFHASSSLADSTNGVSDGLVVWNYGNCPI